VSTLEHTQPVARPWRTATIVASAIAALELVVLIVGAVAIVGQSVADEMEAAATQHVTAPPTPKPRPARALLARGETAVIVPNGNGVPGAASDAAARVRGLGYVVGGVGNAAKTDYGKSVVMYRKGHEGEGRRLARDLRIKIVGPLDGIRAKELMGAHVALILGNS
jgi:hypothetical protein